MRTQFQYALLLAAAFLLASGLAAPAAAQTRTDYIPFRDQEPDLVLLRDGRVLTGDVRELNEQLVIDTPEPVVVPRSLVSLNVQPAIDVGTASCKVEQPGEPGSQIPAGELLGLHRRLTGVMRYAFPPDGETATDQEDNQEQRAPGLSVERIEWLSRLQTAQDLVQRAVEHRLRFEANRMRAKNHASK